MNEIDDLRHVAASLGMTEQQITAMERGIESQAIATRSGLYDLYHSMTVLLQSRKPFKRHSIEAYPDILHVVASAKKDNERLITLVQELLQQQGGTKE